MTELYLDGHTSDCDCVSDNALVPWHTNDTHLDERLTNCDISARKQICRCCSKHVDNPWLIVVITPCRRAAGMHTLRLCVCRSTRCHFYTNGMILAHREILYSNLFAIVPHHADQEQMIEQARQTLRTSFTWDYAHRCELPTCRRLAFIRKDGALTTKRCSRCKRVWYCDQACQRADRHRHAADCVRAEEVEPFRVEMPPELAATVSKDHQRLLAAFSHNLEGVCGNPDCFVRLQPGQCSLESSVRISNVPRDFRLVEYLCFCSRVCQAALFMTFSDLESLGLCTEVASD